MHAFQRAVGTVAATALVGSGLAVTATGASAAEPAGGRIGQPAVGGQQRIDLLPMPDTMPSLGGTGAIGSPLTLLDPVWRLLSPLVRVDEWLCDGVPIPGTAGVRSFTPAPAQAGCVITARLTASILGLLPLPLVTSGVTVPGNTGGDPGDPTEQLRALLDPLLQPFRDRLQVSPLGPEGWSLPGVSESIQWFRDGVPIPGATDWTLPLTPEDAGRQFHAVVTGALGRLPLVNLITQRFTAPAAIEATTPPTIQVPAEGARVGVELTATEVVWGTEGVETTYRWQRNGSDIPGATGRVYRAVAADLGAALTVVATGTREGAAAAGESTSEPVTVQQGAAPQATTLPTVLGEARPGQELSATSGVWSGATGAPAPTYAYQWLRGGQPIAGATGPTYDVGAGDAGQALSVRVTATRAGHAPGSATSEPVVVAKQRTSLVLGLAKKKVRQGTRAAVRIVLGGDAGAAPTGKVQIRRGKRVVKAYRITAAHEGVRTVRLPRLKPGTYRLKAVYVGSRTAEGASSRAVTLKVLRKKR